MSATRLTWLLALTLIGLVTLASSSSAQQPRPELSPPDRGLPSIPGDPVDATHFQPEYQDQEVRVQGIGPDGQPRSFATRRRIPIVQQGYRSPTLQGVFRAERMYITLQGNYIEFIGARILALDPQSPLLMLNLRPGDVITRLDNIEIWQDSVNINGMWRLPELERHYGTTDVRYIRHGSNRVQVGQIVLDSNDNDGNGGFEPLRP